ncbi:RNase H domain-containing protein [Trichonephila clavipes]|nr:RNase H domain-containing protein [Trichonephila clavipes]
MYNTRHNESTLQQGFRYRVLLATKSRRNHRQRASGQQQKSATTHLPLAVPLSDMKRVIMHHIFNIWQESWSQQLDNKLHSVKPVIGAWPVMPLRRTDVKLTRLRIGHTRFTHRHLLFGERAPECPSCHVSYTVHHILIDCPVFNHHRITFFHKSVLTLSDLETCIAQNARPPSTEASPADRRLYEGYGGLRREGWSFRQIAADTNRDVSTVHRLWRRWLAQGNMARSSGPGAARMTSAREDRCIHRQAVAAPQATSTSILQHVQDTLDIPISTRTISRRLVESGLHSRRPLRTLALTPQRRRARLEWCWARETWMTE